jgi:dTDP-glucose 4,6-dehydratase
MSRSLLITGAAGFIGANFVHFWNKHCPEDKIVALDALTYAGNRASLVDVLEKEQVSFVHADICDYATVLATLRAEEIDTVVHFAAESHVDRSITGPDAFIETNIVGTHTLLKACREYWLQSGVDIKHHFHHVSTDEVFGSLKPDAPPFHEQQKYEPNSPYSASKAASDHLVRAYTHTYGLQTTISNCSNNYGPYQFPEKLIPLCVTNLLRGLSVPVYGDGGNIRDWLYVEDHCRGIERVITRGKVGETYNIGGNNEWRNIDIVKLVCTRLDQRFKHDSQLSQRYPDAPQARGNSASDLISFVEDRAGHDWRYAINASKDSRELGLIPDENFETGLEKTLDWYLGNEGWWRPLLPLED